MKEKIHPQYFADAKVVCASCGNTFTTGSTRKSLKVEVCNKCHPFFTGERSRVLDTAGRVERFKQRYKSEEPEKAAKPVKAKKAKKVEATET